jgi:aspartate/methionine/tyrosine aminotransferase
MTLKLKSRQYMAQPLSYKIAERVGGSRYQLAGAKALGVSLGEIIDLDPKMSLKASQDVDSTLKEEIIKVNGYDDFMKNDILLTTGTYEANFLILSEAVEAAEEIVLSTPCWYQYAAYSLQEKKYYFCCGGLHPLVKVHVLVRKEDEDWSYDVERLQEIASDKTALIVVNSPNNPTGAVSKNPEMRAICEIAEDTGSYVLHDEIYRGLEWDKPFSSPQAVTMYDKAAATNSLSKSLGFDGLRVGWLATKDKKLMARCKAINEWYHMGEGGISILSKTVATAALEQDKFMQLLDHGRKIGQECWDIVAEWITKYEDVFDWKKPEAGVLSFPRYHLDIGSWELCERLAAEPYKTTMLPGIIYGFEKHMRLGVGYETPENVKLGLEQVSKLIKNLR